MLRHTFGNLVSGMHRLTGLRYYGRMVTVCITHLPRQSAQTLKFSKASPTPG